MTALPPSHPAQRRTSPTSAMSTPSRALPPEAPPAQGSQRHPAARTERAAPPHSDPAQRSAAQRSTPHYLLPGGLKGDVPPANDPTRPRRTSARPCGSRPPPISQRSIPLPPPRCSGGSVPACAQPGRTVPQPVEGPS